MKFILPIVIFTGAIILLSMKKHPKAEDAGTFEPVGVIELFTSQGCSSCPSADRLLAQTIADANINEKKIFALSFHVDYWNRLGWTDPFSTHAFSERQSEYASKFNLSGPYTPQMVVNGNYEFTGSDKAALAISLNKSLKEKAEVDFVKLKVDWETDKPLKVKYEIEGNYKESVINFALVSMSETTVIKKGENGGRTLKNENVVREWVTKDASSSGEIKFSALPEGVIKENMKLIAYVQKSDTYAVIGAAMAPLK